METNKSNPVKDTKNEKLPDPDVRFAGKYGLKWMLWICVLAIVALIIWWSVPKSTSAVDVEQTIVDSQNVNPTMVQDSASSE